jgi:hypothetical protein
LQVTFREATEDPDRNQEYVFTRVKCFPLFSLLLAINATAFNYLSLDAEGAEIQVPKSVDWFKGNMTALIIYDSQHIKCIKPKIKLT